MLFFLCNGKLVVKVLLKFVYVHFAQAMDLTYYRVQINRKDQEEKKTNKVQDCGSAISVKA